MRMPRVVLLAAVLWLVAGCGNDASSGGDDAPDTRSQRDASAPTCGDGVVEGGEECDDQNRSGADGCLDCRLVHANACVPCTTDAGCGIFGVCRTFEDGAFCSTACDVAPCPGGYACRDTDDGLRCEPVDRRCLPCPDDDGDRVCDADDLCPGFNDGVDADADGVPDGCDPCPLDAGGDSDGDGVCDSTDVCQGSDDRVDSDGDTVADGCDPCPLDNPDDTDGDGVCDSIDVCRGSDDRVDSDGDSVADGCDPCPLDNPDDTDGDGSCDSDDPCPLDNPDDTDNDGVCDSDDACPGFDDSADEDDDGTPDGCDACPLALDADNDGVCDALDPCPRDNPDDTDADGVCDSDDPCPLDNPNDTDGDGVCDSDDDCPAGDDTIDTDDDGVCDAADPCPLDNPDDTDADGVCDADDACPGFDDRLDENRDGTPDGCEPDTSPGAYTYDRVVVGGLGNLQAVEIAPSGRFALIAERTTRLRVLNRATGDTTAYDVPRDGSDALYWEDLVFAPDGSTAWLLANRFDDGNWAGPRLFALDVGAWESGAELPAALSEIPLSTTRPRAAALGVHPETGEVVLLSRTARSPYTMWLDAVDPDTGAVTSLTATATSAGCQDLAFAYNELGGDGWLIVCGENGADVWTYKQIGAVWELVRPTTGSTGNISRTFAHPGGTYALAVGWSGDLIFTFEAGIWSRLADFSTRRLWTGAFHPDGSRALVVGGVQNIRGEVFANVHELRDGFRACPTVLTPSCEVTEVSIPAFDVAPFLGTTSYQLNDVAWWPDCDGGLIASGASNFAGDEGRLIAFERVGGRRCDETPDTGSD